MFRPRYTGVIGGGCTASDHGTGDIPVFIDGIGHILDGKQGYSCSVIGDLISIIARMDGSQLSVVQTGESRYGTPDSPLLEKAFFISLPDDGEA